MKNGIFITAALLLFVGIGCAQVQVKAPKDPIKVDITMRLDVYQHVEKDIDTIEDIVSGKSTPKPREGMQLNLLFTNAYAEEGMSSDVEKAALRRRDRKDELVSWERKGVIGENRMGLVEARSGQAPGGLVSAENADRMVIYKAISQKNGAALEDVQKLYAKRLIEDAPAGTPIEVMDASGNYGWKKK
ncbi:MAG: DUF1318 domain-containing protein [Candidatus Omnitrophica bacterium]|nr:DUF1318 domain-containing protein [Candidatus Omnitrophota bacterium]